jgi:2-(1,2-epoxy-1,2-dihydrophenyl)acetyl-CoA isomerase
MEESIRVSEGDGLRVITLNRPAVMNALNGPMRAELTAAVIAPGARCIVLTGAGRGFCSGQDLTDTSAIADIEGTLAREYEPMLRAMPRRS